jgi:NitT/TauT family transport system permease protein
VVLVDRYASIELAEAEASPEPCRPPEQRPGSRLLVWAARIALVAAFIGAWQWYGSRSAVDRSIFSTPGSVLTVLGGWTHDTAFWDDLRISLTEAVLGYLLGVLMAVILASVVFSSSLVERFLRPFIAVFNALPKVVLAPLFLLWFGIGISSKVYFTASVIFFIVFYGVYAGMKSIDLTLVDNMRALGASTLSLVRHVYGPAILTWIVAGLRLSFSFALLATVLAEFLGGSEGLGVRISLASQQLENNVVIAGILTIALVAVLFDRALTGVEQRFAKWKLF